MNKELFVYIVNKMYELYQEQEKFDDVLKMLDNDFGGCLIHNKTISLLEEILKKLVNDKYDYIGYYLWELDFGKEYKDGVITEDDGSIIKLSNPEELYDLIISEQE